MGPFTLPSPARYFPPHTGRYDVAPGLKPLGTPFGNGAADERLFQIDTGFAEYRQNKQACRAERLTKYVVQDALPPAVSTAVADFLAARFAAEYPSLFLLRRESDGSGTLHCRLAGERLRFDGQMGLAGVHGAPAAVPPYASAFDALCMQVPEDVAVVCTSPERGDWIAALHLCSPSHWGAEAKAGKSFADAHAPVPGMAKVNAAAAALMEAMIYKGPWVRFVWGFGADRRLNHHPEPPPGVLADVWRGQALDPAGRPPFFLRVERQCLWGLPEVDAAIFTIRISFVDGEAIRANAVERSQLCAALRSMTPESRRYKNVAERADEIITWLETGPHSPPSPA